MKLLLVCIDGLRLDIALPEALQRDPGFTHPDHPADPRFVRGVGQGDNIGEGAHHLAAGLTQRP